MYILQVKFDFFCIFKILNVNSVSSLDEPFRLLEQMLQKKLFIKKIDFRLTLIQTKLILNFLCLPWLGLKGNWKSIWPEIKFDPDYSTLFRHIKGEFKDFF